MDTVFLLSHFSFIHILSCYLQVIILKLELFLYSDFSHSSFFSCLPPKILVRNDYIAKDTYEGSLEVQKQLIVDYKEDIRKYAEGIDQTRIVNVFNHIPAQLGGADEKLDSEKRRRLNVYERTGRNCAKRV